MQSESMTRTSIFAVLVFVALGGIAGAQTQYGPRLTEAEIRGALFGNTMVGQSADGTKWTMFNAADGALHMVGTTPNGAAIDDRGQVTMVDNQWCRAFRTLGAGARRCANVHRLGDRFTNLNADGTINSTYTVKPGNPDRL
jgi:hypothetical protein